MPYHNVPPHRLNGPRESMKFNTADGEMASLERQVLTNINLLLLVIDRNKLNVSLASLLTDQE